MVKSKLSKNLEKPKSSYKNMILSEITNINITNKWVSRFKLTKSTFENYDVRVSPYLHRFYLKKAINHLLMSKMILKRRESFKLAKSSKAKKNKKVSKIKSKKKSTEKLNLSVEKKDNDNKMTIKLKTKHIKIKQHKTVIPSYSTLVKEKPTYKKRWPATWQYYDDNNFKAKIKSLDNWYDYDPEASDTVEDEWQKYIVNRGMNDVRSVKSGEWEYMVDFVNWNQTNIVHQAHKMRSIRRLDPNGAVTKNPY
jgi:hypothetical protein